MEYNRPKMRPLENKLPVPNPTQVSDIGLLLFQERKQNANSEAFPHASNK